MVLLYIHLLKSVWFYGEYNKSYERGNRKCHLKVVSIFSFEIVGWRAGRIAAYYPHSLYPQILKNRLLQPVCLLRIVPHCLSKFWHAACLLPCSGMTDKWHLSRRFYAGPAKWRENNGAEMTSRSFKRFPANKRNKESPTHTSRFKILTAAHLSPKGDFERLFNFQGPVISECIIVVTHCRWAYCIFCSKWPWKGCGRKLVSALSFVRSTFPDLQSKYGRKLELQKKRKHLS